MSQEFIVENVNHDELVAWCQSAFPDRNSWLAYTISYSLDTIITFDHDEDATLFALRWIK